MVLADTGYWLALANSRDRWHEAAVAATRRLDEDLVVTWPVITETCHLLLSRLGVHAELRFIDQMSRNVICGQSAVLEIQVKRRWRELVEGRVPDKGGNGKCGRGTIRPGRDGS